MNRHWPLLFALATTPALAWEFSASPLCTITDQQAGVGTVVTYDPRTQLYAMEMTVAGGWADGDVFGLAFRGGRELTITTNRQTISGNQLRVADTGFGNVLDGLALNTRAIAFLDDQTHSLDLTGAAAAVEAFRACAEGPVA